MNNSSSVTWMKIIILYDYLLNLTQLLHNILLWYINRNKIEVLRTFLEKCKCKL